MPPVAKLALANLPTPLFHHDALDRLVGCEVWVKRDDMTGGVESGNKVRKLEYLMAEAQARGARAVITCGGLQSNHCRATAAVARQLGMRPILLLRHDGPLPDPPSGNLFIDQLFGAELHIVSPAEYGERDTLMARLANDLQASGEPAYVIPEGGSNGLGTFGYIEAMNELAGQLAQGQARLPGEPPVSGFDAVAFACGSGGTAAGIALGLGKHPVATAALAFAVCDDQAFFQRRVADIVAEARALDPQLPAPGHLVIEDRFKGPAYGVASQEQQAFVLEVARTTGLVVDHVYAGKALSGLAQLTNKPARVCFVHTGGLPGLLAAPQVLR